MGEYKTCSKLLRNRLGPRQWSKHGEDCLVSCVKTEQRPGSLAESTQWPGKLFSYLSPHLFSTLGKFGLTEEQFNETCTPVCLPNNAQIKGEEDIKTHPSKVYQYIKLIEELTKQCRHNLKISDVNSAGVLWKNNQRTHKKWRTNPESKNTTRERKHISHRCFVPWTTLIWVQTCGQVQKDYKN